MFRCNDCNKSVGPGVSAITRVVATRDVNYVNEVYIENDFGDKEKKIIESFGKEIVKEVKLCQDCANNLPLGV